MKLSHPSLLCLLLLATSTAQANRVAPKPVHSPLPITLSTQTHFVQFFSSINATKAEGMKNTLVLQGYPAFVFVNIPKLKTRTYYQVQVGPFISRDLAKKAKTQVIQKYPEYSFLNDAILKTSL